MPSHPDRVRRHYEHVRPFIAMDPFWECPICREQFMEMADIGDLKAKGRWKDCCERAVREFAAA